PGHDHDQYGQDVDPVGNPNDPRMDLDALSFSRCHRCAPSFRRTPILRGAPFFGCAPWFLFSLDPRLAHDLADARAVRPDVVREGLRRPPDPLESGQALV